MSPECVLPCSDETTPELAPSLHPIPNASVDVAAAGEADVDMWRSLADASSDWIVMADRDARCQYVNQTAASMLGADRQEMIGASFLSFFSKAFFEERLSLIRRSIDADEHLLIFETIRGWRGSTRVRPMPVDRNGQRLTLIMWQPGVVAPPPELSKNATKIEPSVHDGDPIEELTLCEIDALRLIGEGHSTAQIAQKLNRAVKTVEWHRSSLGKKLGVTNRVELAWIAFRAGLISRERHLQPPAAQTAISA